MKSALRKAAILLLALAAAACLAGCARKDDAIRDDIAGKTYVWEKEGFGGDFKISLLPDGTYQYYAGYLSSYIGMGEWTVKDGVLMMTENTGYDLAFRFRVKEDRLLYIAEGSSPFAYVTVEDGDAFLYREDLGPEFVIED